MLIRSRRMVLFAASLAGVMLLSTVGTALANPIWGDFITDEDNQNNWGWGGADGDLDGVYAATLLYGKSIVNFTPPPNEKYEQMGLFWYYPYICPWHATSPVEFDITLPYGEFHGGGSLTIYTYWVRSGEAAYVYLNSTYVGSLTPTGEKQNGSTTFNFGNAADLLSPGRGNRVTVRPAATSCTAVMGGKLHLASPRAQIRGHVFEDLNRNGIRDEGEPGIPGVTVRFYPNGQDIIVPLTTGDDGTYGLTQVEWGDWNVAIDTPAGYDVTTQAVQSFRLENTDIALGVNFGLAVPATPTPTPTATRTPTPD